MEVMLDLVVRVDRSVRPVYPPWVKKVVHQDLEGLGPTEYNPKTTVEQWLHHDQRNGRRAFGYIIYNYLNQNERLTSHLGLADLVAIREKGPVIFHKLYADKAVYGWRSVVQDRKGRLNVPFLILGSDYVFLSWAWLDHDWDFRHPALRFSK